MGLSCAGLQLSVKTNATVMQLAVYLIGHIKRQGILIIIAYMVSY